MSRPEPEATPLSGLSGTTKTPSAHPSATPPPSIPDHELLRPIGGGSYGEVWLARNVMGTLRAIKTVHRRTFDRDDHFEREFKGIQKFEPISRSHEGLVDILQIGRNDAERCFYYVMELADDAHGESAQVRKWESEKMGTEAEAGLPPAPSPTFPPASYTPRTLQSDIKDHGPLPLSECSSIGLALTAALEHLHKSGLVHRDIKPSNIIFVNGAPKLADIGLVAEAGEAKSLVGTVGYIPPEGPGTAQADLFSLGKVLYELITGKDRQDFPALPAEFRERADAAQLTEFNEILLKACESDPRHRYASAHAMHEDLVLLQRGRSVIRKRTAQRRWMMTKRVAPLTALLALLVGAVPLFNRFQRERIPEPEAQRLYELGRWHYNQSTEESRMKAISYLDEAIRIDTNFAPAYAMLFELHMWDTDEETNFRINRQLAEKLLALDPKLAEGHAALSWTKYGDNDWHGALVEIRQAIKLSPNYSTAHGMYCYYLSLLGRVEQAIKQSKLVQQIDPTSRLQNMVAGYPFLAARQYDLAIAQFRKVIELDKHFPHAHRWLAKSFEAKGDYLHAIDEYEKLDRLSGASESQLAREYPALRQAFHEAGARGYWLKALELQQSASSLVGKEKKLAEAYRYDLAMIYAQLGEKRKALDELEQAYDRGERDSWMRFEPLYEPLHTEPRFQALLKKLGLAD